MLYVLMEVNAKYEIQFVNWIAQKKAFATLKQGTEQIVSRMRGNERQELTMPQGLFDTYIRSNIFFRYCVTDGRRYV